MHLSPKSSFATILWASLGWVIVALALAPSLRAQPVDAPTYDFVARAIPLSRALERLVSETRIDLYYDPPLVAGKRANCVMQDARAEDLLRCLLRDTGLDFIRLSSGLYVITEATETVPRFGKLRGIVVDAETGQPLSNAHVMLTEASTGTTSNEAGLFAFARLKPGRYQVVAQYIGYRPSARQVEVPPGGDTEAELALRSEPMLVETIVVDGLQWRLPSKALGQVELLGDDAGAAPAPPSNAVLGGLNRLMGVRVTDATADVHIQGGETGESQVRLDGVPVFLPLGFATFAGPFSPFAVGSITVHKAGFGVSQGSQIAGVVDIAHELSVRGAWQLDVQADPLSLNVRAGLRAGAAGGTQTTLVASGRTSLWRLYQPPTLRTMLDQWNRPDPFLRAAFEDPLGGNFKESVSGGNPRIGFHDLHLASRTRFGLLNSLYASLYWGGNRLGADLAPDPPAGPSADAPAPFRDLYAWRTGMAQVRYESVLGSRTLAALRLRGSYYRVDHDYNVPDSALARTIPVLRPDDGNRVYEVALEATVDHALGSRQNVRLGAELIRTDSRFVVLGTRLYPIDHQAAGMRLVGFAEDEVTLSPYASVEAGGRFTLLPATGAVYAEPRLSLRLDVAESPVGAWSMRLSAGVYRQFLNQFDVSSRSPGALLSSTRFWLVTDSTVNPPRAAHVAADWLFRPSDGWTVRLEAYHKEQQHALALNYTSAPGEAPTEAIRQRDFLEPSRGTVSGAGVQVERRLGPGRVEARYEYSLARRAIRGLFGDSLHRAPWDEPHRLTLALDVSPLRNLTVVARWQGVWGRTWAFRQSYYHLFGVYGDLNQTGVQYRDNILRQVEYYALRTPDRHRLAPLLQLDLGVAYALRVGATSVQLRADLLNALDRRNEAEWYLHYDPGIFYGDEPSDEVPIQGLLVKRSRPLLPRYFSMALRVSW